MDLTAVIAAFGTLNIGIATVGGLILSAAALAVTYKWIKGMIFS